MCFSLSSISMCDSSDQREVQTTKEGGGCDNLHMILFNSSLKQKL